MNSKKPIKSEIKQSGTHNSGKCSTHLLAETSHLMPLFHIMCFNMSHTIQHPPQSISNGHQIKDTNAIGKNIADKNFKIQCKK